MAAGMLLALLPAPLAAQGQPPSPFAAEVPPDPVAPPARATVDRGLAIAEVLKRGQALEGAAGVLLVETDGGEVLGAAGSAEGVDLGSTMALAAAQYLRQERRVAERLGLDDPLEEVLVTTAGRYYLVRALGAGGAHFLLFVLDRQEADLGRAQLDLMAIERELVGVMKA